MRIYDLQSAPQLAAFEHSRDLWAALGLESLTAETLSRYLGKQWSAGGLRLITKRYVSEVAAALTRVNYNQSPEDITALAGLIGMAPDDTTFMVEGGMSQVAKGLVAHSGAHVHLHTHVERITRDSERSRWIVGSKSEAKNGDAQLSVQAGNRSTLLFDAVVIAAPMATAGLVVTGAPKGWPPAQSYQNVVTTFVKGRLRAAYFGAFSEADLPTFVGTAQGSTAPFTSISVLGGMGNGTRLFKMFSTSASPHKAVETAFEAGAEVVASKRWAAYPKFSAPEALGLFRVADGLYYANAIEAGASCIEIAAIGGVNIAQLVQQDETRHAQVHLARTAVLRDASEL